MTSRDVAKSGMTLGRSEGLADLRATSWRYTLPRAALTAIAIGSFVTGIAATSAALKGVADPGVASDAPGGLVLSASPTGFAWRDGIRAGQVVFSVSRADEPTGWRLETEHGQFASSAAPVELALRDSLVLGLVGLVAGALALGLLRTRRRLVFPIAALAIFSSSTPLWLSGQPVLSTVGLAEAAFLPGFWVALHVPARRAFRLAVVAVLGTLLVAWLAARLGGLEAYERLEYVRGAVAVAATAIVVGARAVVPMVSAGRPRFTRPALSDVVAVAAVGGLSLVLVNQLDVSPVAIAVVLVIALLAVPALRRRFGRPLQDALLADIREQAAAEGAEDERARLARDLHDVPLQELVAVIRRLEILPGAEAERDDLRALAGHLRNVATDLRPPVLDDFGLPASIEYLAEEATSDAMPVAADVEDGTGFATETRPPKEVELAVFRIAREAVTNAVRHSGGTAVHIRASVRPDRVKVSVEDDGNGLSPGDARRAARRKRLGLASMRRRADAIDADLTIEGSSRGTTVEVTWQR
jgi:signal transduction histidine kinase